MDNRGPLRPDPTVIMRPAAPADSRMEIRRLTGEEPHVERFVRELWLPYRRELEARVPDTALTDGVNVVDLEVAYRRELLERDDHWTWVAVDGDGGGRGDDDSDDGGSDRHLDDAEPLQFPEDGEREWGGDGGLAGFVTADLDAASPVFDRPDRLHVGDIYVQADYRGTGLGRRLLELVALQARARACTELVLDVDVDNEAAVGFYERLGFEVRRWEMRVDVDSLRL